MTDLKVTTANHGIIIKYSYELSIQSPEVHCIEWKKNGKPLIRDFGGRFDDKFLTIASPTYEDRGEYSCTLTNAVGPVSKIVMLGIYVFPYCEFLHVTTGLRISKIYD